MRPAEQEPCLQSSHDAPGSAFTKVLMGSRQEQVSQGTHRAVCVPLSSRLCIENVQGHNSAVMPGRHCRQH